MAEEQTVQQKGLQLQRIYLKDVSFETPGVPKVFTEQWEPQVEVQISSAAQSLGNENDYEVELTLTVTARKETATVYLIEVKQAGVFSLTGMAEEERGFLLGAYCPNLLFPYVRETLSGLASKGTFPQLLLQPINFEALYQQGQMQQRPKAQTLN
jgi:preprotein translocase subunit SecB